MISIEYFNKNPELLKAFTNGLASVLVLALIATLIQTFSKKPPELWESSLHIAGTISVILYMGMFNSNFTFYRWLTTSKSPIFIIGNLSLGLFFTLIPFILKLIENLLIKPSSRTKQGFDFINIYKNHIMSFFINFASISFYSLGFTILILLIMSYFTRKLIKDS